MKKLLIFALLCALLATPFSALASGAWSMYQASGSRDESRISITIDDWWEPALLADFLDVADEYGVKLTVYPCGCNLHPEDADLWRRALDEGHEIGSHGFCHVDFSTRSGAQITHDFEKFGKTLDEVLGYHYEFLTVRLPKAGSWREGGAGRTGRLIHAAGFDHVIFWDMDKTNDVSYALRKIKNGSIVLMHANRHDLKFFKNLMEALKDKGFEYVTISDLLHITTRLRDDEPAAQDGAAT